MADVEVLEVSRPVAGVTALVAHLPDGATVDGILRPASVVSRIGLGGRGNGPELVLVATEGPAGDDGGLAIAWDGGEARLHTDHLSAVEVGPQELMTSHLAAADPAVRAAVVASLASLTGLAAGRPSDDVAELSRWLHALREGLRERLPLATVQRGERPGMSVELVAAADDCTFFVRGWIGHPTARLTSFTALSPEGESIDVLDLLWRYPRTDVDEFYGRPAGSEPLGFSLTLTTSAPSFAADGWVFQVEVQGGGAFETPARPVLRDPVRVRQVLLADLVLEELPDDELRRRHIAPALGALQDRRRRQSHAASLDQFGEAPDDPEVTVVVPLYGRVDYVMHQLAHFVSDPELAAADLVYVLDQPELSAGLRAEAQRLHRLYGVPFRLVVAAENGGFALANNLGASFARGRLLLLLNSDIIPAGPGWLGNMVRFHDQTENVGAVGPKLLFEDESVQHAGMYFDRVGPVGLWGNEHYFKGFHRSFQPATVTRPVPAVSAACLMVETALYLDMGGLGGQYLQGDFEDSDLCLRLTQRGLRNWYLADVELYHLEGQSYATSERVANGQFNQWLHHRLWDDSIRELMAEPGTTPADVAVLHGGL